MIRTPVALKQLTEDGKPAWNAILLPATSVIDNQGIGYGLVSPNRLSVFNGNTEADYYSPNAQANLTLISLVFLVTGSLPAVFAADTRPTPEAGPGGWIAVVATSSDYNGDLILVDA